MEKIFKVINEMYQKGIFKDYAIGGAVENAILVKYRNIEVKILRPEYLITIFLNVYRPKDRDKLIKLLDQTNIDKTFLSDILERHNLDKKFNDFMKKYYE